LTTKNVYDIHFLCCPYTDGYFRSIFYDISHILIASEVLISTCTKNDKKHIFTEKYTVNFFGFLGNVLIGVHTNYIQKINNFTRIFP